MFFVVIFLWFDGKSKDLPWGPCNANYQYDYCFGIHMFTFYSVLPPSIDMWNSTKSVFMIVGRMSIRDTEFKLDQYLFI